MSVAELMFSVFDRAKKSFRRHHFVLVLIGICLSGCGRLQPADFATSTTRFKPDEYFLGHVRSWGIQENRTGEPRSRFTTESFGENSAEGEMTITQVFTKENGKKQERLWKVRRLDEHRYEGTANDVVGKARGVAYGNAFRWKYTIALKPGNRFSHVRLKQWMYLPDGSEKMFTRAIVTKFGVTVAEVTESFEKIPARQIRKAQ
jgi:hypothetical protein